MASQTKEDCYLTLIWHTCISMDIETVCPYKSAVTVALNVATFDCDPFVGCFKITVTTAFLLSPTLWENGKNGRVSVVHSLRQ